MPGQIRPPSWKLRVADIVGDYARRPADSGVATASGLLWPIMREMGAEIDRLEAANDELVRALACVMDNHPLDHIPCSPPNPEECGLCWAKSLVDKARADGLLPSREGE